MHYFKLFIIISFFLIFSISGKTELLTPLEKSNYTQLSSHSDMMNYLKKLNYKSDILQLKIIGTSVEGREIPALFFTLDNKLAAHRDKKPLVFIFCQQHGDEPSGKEAALVLARELTSKNKKMLENFDLILVPQVNPDGAEKGQRRNANDMDLNRNHVILSEPEARAIHDLFLKWMPEVTMDVHEYNAISKYWVSHGFVKDAEEQLGGVTNVNISPEIMNFTRQKFFPAVEAKIEASGFTFHRYLVGSPFEGSRLRYSTTAVNDGRQSKGIYNTLSFILEGKQYHGLITNIERRTQGQVVAMTSFLETVSENRAKLLDIVSNSRKQLLDKKQINSQETFIQMDYYPHETDTTLIFPIFDLKTWQHQERELPNFHSQVRVRKSVKKPLAYIIPKSQKRLIDVLERHHLNMSELQKDISIELEVYQFQHITSFIEEGLTVPYVDVETQTVMKNVQKGSKLIYLNQPAQLLLPLILEPQSTKSLMTESSGRSYRFDEYLKEGTEYPIYRLMKDVDLPLHNTK